MLKHVNEGCSGFKTCAHYTDQKEIASFKKRGFGLPDVTSRSILEAPAS